MPRGERREGNEGSRNHPARREHRTTRRARRPRTRVDAFEAVDRCLCVVKTCWLTHMHRRTKSVTDRSWVSLFLRANPETTVCFVSTPSPPRRHPNRRRPTQICAEGVCGRADSRIEGLRDSDWVPRVSPKRICGEETHLQGISSCQLAVLPAQNASTTGSTRFSAGSFVIPRRARRRRERAARGDGHGGVRGDSRVHGVG